jgi:hypothetical protein
MTDDLELATRSQKLAEDGLFEAQVPDGWQQGRGAYGGLTIAALLRAVEAYANTPDRRLRSLSAELPGPTLVGANQIRVENLRAGSAQSTLTARLGQDGQVSGICVAVMGRARAPGYGEFCEIERPSLRPWREIEPLPALAGGPTFSKHFEFRLDGPLPYSASPSARSLGWIRPRRCGAAMSGTAYLAAMIDVWWPAMFTRAAAVFPVATVAYTLQVVTAADSFDPQLPLAFRAHAWVLSQGHFVEQRELWSEDGQLLALNQQTFAIIK